VIDGRWRGLGIATVVFLFAPPLAAAPIEWEAPEGCPDRDAVLEGLRQALGVQVIGLGRVSRVRAVVVADTAAATPRYRLALELVDGARRSTRSFEAEHCEDLARTAALAISLAVHQSSAANESATPSGRESSVHEGAATPLSSPPHRDAELEPGLNGDDAAAPWWWSAGANAVLDVGALPEPAIGIGLEARAGFGPLELDVHALLLPRQRSSVGLNDAVELGLMAAGLRACLRVLDRAVVIAGCVAAEAGQFTAEGVGLDPGRSVHDPWLAAGPAALARTAFDGPLQLEFLAEPLLPLARKQYAVDGTDIVHSPSVVNVRLQLGLIIGAPNRANGS
jgi:hypothetical protein